MEIKEKSIIELENIHKIEPFFIRYLTIISFIILIISFIFFFGTNRLSEEYNTINIWYKESDYIYPAFHDSNFNIDGIFKHNFFSKPEGIIHYFDINGNTTYNTNLSRGELVAMNNDNFIVYIYLMDYY